MKEYFRIIWLGQELCNDDFVDITQAYIKELMQDQDLNAVDLIEIVKSCKENSVKYDFKSDT